MIDIVNKIVNFVNSIPKDMASDQIRFNTKTKYLLGITGLLFISLLCAAFSLTKSNDFELAKQEILLRKIGHEILLHAGDSTSRVLPIKKITENEYQIRFENEFTFQPDSLVKIIGQSLSKDQLASNYIVNVVNCTAQEVIFGYAIFKNEKNNIVACSGRTQPKDCYLINIKFESPGITLPKNYLIGGLPLLAFVGLLITRSFKTQKKKLIDTVLENESFKIGNTLFDVTKRNLIFTETTTELTIKEYKLLLIFAKSPNVIVERNRLQKEIWEDEGVIVGRSLDMFISKLRKKLEGDSTIQLVNIHGKGYKLAIEEA